MSMLPAYRKEEPSTALLQFGSNLGWQPSARTKDWVRRRLTQMAREEGKTLEQLQPAFAQPPHCPKQRAEMDMLMDSRQEHVQRWLDERRDREELTPPAPRMRATA
jgi:CRP-like cAMP-binding protein